jgi:uncharacterized OB-fold protein
MTDTGVDSAAEPSAFLAHECDNGHLTYPGHTVCPECGEPQTGTVNLLDRDGTVVTWTTVSATPVGVRAPNTLAIVEFQIDEQRVRALGGTTEDVDIGDRVTPVYVEELRPPDEGMRAAASQRWDGVRFQPSSSD